MGDKKFWPKIIEVIRYLRIIWDLSKGVCLQYRDGVPLYMHSYSIVMNFIRGVWPHTKMNLYVKFVYMLLCRCSYTEIQLSTEHAGSNIKVLWLTGS